MVPTLLDLDEPIFALSGFFIDFKGESQMNSDFMLNTFAFHYKSLKLPNFSDDSNNMRVFNA